MASDLSLSWRLSGRGWANCTIADHEREADLTASSINEAQEDLLNAVSRVLTGQTEVRTQFEAEPTAYRWVFYRQDTTVWIRIVELSHGELHNNAGTEVWSSWQPVDRLVRAVIRCFDQVADTYGESAYRGKWGDHFPRTELEALRRLWRRRGAAGGA
ncbi:hypothetical protein ACFXEL_34340 [Streptomyces sp. NPDC059382]|uniref:hypothetical protein n=1 Tax=Streptomyces sp. NPDC059382 TaxID=3346816 RepID=UPI0036B7FA70